MLWKFHQASEIHWLQLHQKLMQSYKSPLEAHNIWLSSFRSQLIWFRGPNSDGKMKKSGYSYSINILEPAVHGRGAGRHSRCDFRLIGTHSSKFWVDPSSNIRNIRNLHRQFEIQMLVENHKCRCATFASGFTNDLTPPIGELFGPLERSNCPINPNPLSLALECLIVLDTHTDRQTDADSSRFYLVMRPTFRKCASGAIIIVNHTHKNMFSRSKNPWVQFSEISNIFWISQSQIFGNSVNKKFGY